jgi:hypothetical protein
MNPLKNTAPATTAGETPAVPVRSLNGSDADQGLHYRLR